MLEMPKALNKQGNYHRKREGIHKRIDEDGQLSVYGGEVDKK
jgi:hypothetical protein